MRVVPYHTIPHPILPYRRDIPHDTDRQTDNTHKDKKSIPDLIISYRIVVYETRFQSNRTEPKNNNKRNPPHHLALSLISRSLLLLLLLLSCSSRGIR